MPGDPSFVATRLPLAQGHLTYHRLGDGAQAVLLLHGLGDNGLCWARTARRLAQEFTVLLLDSRGHGDSSMPTSEGYEPAEDIREVLDQLGIDRAFLLGHSVGAIFASQFAATYGHRVIALALEDPPLRAQLTKPSEELVTAFAEQIERFRGMDRAEVIAAGRRQHPTWDHQEFDAWAQGKQQVQPEVLRRCVFPGWRELLGDLQIPTLLMRGQPGSDSTVSARTADEITAANAHIQSVVIEGAGHNIRRENFAQYVDVVLEFFRSSPQPAR